MYSIELSDEAQADYENAVVWYEGQKVGLGFDFSVRLAEVFESIGQFPERQRFIYDDRRFAFVKQFPYKVYFIVDEPNLHIIVFAILHEKRDTQIWKKRSDKLG
ncbi:MAG: type II toxin-antitoxin system RelE/ParE family toxin [Lewinellaceae bacterium]|nr:type II toxin-antitoxin system RelE/ParE family toxin [Lewinellaceae bacterium]